MAGPCRIPKLTVRVRFPSPAPHAKSVAAHTNRAKIQPLGSSVRSMRFHPLAIDSRSSRQDQPTRGPPIRVLVMTSSPQLVVQSVSDRTVSPTSRVLIDDCRVHAVVTHPRHQVTPARAGLSRQDRDSPRIGGFGVLTSRAARAGCGHRPGPVPRRLGVRRTRSCINHAPQGMGLVKTRSALGQKSGARSLLSGADRAYRPGTAPGRCGTPTRGP